MRFNATVSCIYLLSHPKVGRFIQTEAERRRREAGVIQFRSKTGSSCMYICIYVCMFFKDISRLRPLREAKVVPLGSSLDTTLVRHNLHGVRFPTSAWRVREVSIIYNWLTVSDRDMARDS